MSHRFIDGVLRSDADPVEDAVITPFDFDSVFAHLDGVENPTQYDYAVALGRVLRWLVDVNPQAVPGSKRATIAGRRAFVLTWAVVPGVLGNMSLRALGQYLHTQHQRLGEIAARLPRELNFRGARQRLHLRTDTTLRRPAVEENELTAVLSAPPMEVCMEVETRRGSPPRV